MQYIIKDWAGNTMFNGLAFDSFDDAWSHIIEYLTEELNYSDLELDAACGEYYVEQQ